eukprot:5448770-Pyramimonas_sp.AAC.1
MARVGPKTVQEAPKTTQEDSKRVLRGPEDVTIVGFAWVSDDSGGTAFSRCRPPSTAQGPQD